MKLVIFGAGATGRGHIAELATRHGWHLVLIDRDEELIATLRGAGRYTVRLFGPQPRTVAVTNFAAFASDQAGEINRAVADADLICTAVLADNFETLAPVLLAALDHRRRVRPADPVNVVCCENLADSGTRLRGLLLAQAETVLATYLHDVVGLPNCMVSRVVPVPTGDRLELITEDYNEWTVDANQFRGSALPLPDMELVDNQAARLERKLYIHNGGHVVCGFFGHLRGHRYIHEAAGDPVVGEAVVGAINEAGRVIERRHGFSAESIARYKQDLLDRGAVAEMRDEIARVVRSPIRKLAPGDRLLGPAEGLIAMGEEPVHLAAGVAAGLRVRVPDDPQSAQLGAWIADEGLSATLVRVCGLQPADRLHELIRNAYEDLTA